MVRNLAMTTDLNAIGNTVVLISTTVQFGSKMSRPLRGILNPCGAMEAWAKLLGDGEDAKGYPGVILSVTKSPGFDTLSLTDEVGTALED